MIKQLSMKTAQCVKAGGVALLVLLGLSAGVSQAQSEGEYRLGVPRSAPAAPQAQLDSPYQNNGQGGFQNNNAQPGYQGGASSNAGSSLDYRLAGGDDIKISVFQNPDLATQTRLSESGVITFPLIGSVKVGGLTLSQAEREIARRLKNGGFVIDAQVSIVLAEIVGNQVSVLGQVSKPGSYPLLNNGYRLSQILAAAGGISPAGGDTVVLTGTRGGQPFRAEVDVESFYAPDRPASEDMVLASGDSIYVPRAQQFFIYGQVQRPGAYPLSRNMTVMQALAQGGGLTLRGTERSLRIHRKDAKGQMKEIKPKMSDLVKPEDVLDIGESLF